MIVQSEVGQRVARFPFPIEVAFHTMYSACNGPTILSGEGVPEDATLLGWRLNESGLFMEVLLQSETFEPYSGPPGKEPLLHWTVKLSSDQPPPKQMDDSLGLILPGGAN